MKVISKNTQLFDYMLNRMKGKGGKGWNYEQLDRATGGKTGFNGLFIGKTSDMKLATILRILAVLDLELVVRAKEKPKRVVASAPSTVVSPLSDTPREAEPQA